MTTYDRGKLILIPFLLGLLFIKLISLFWIIEDFYDSDATQFSESDDDNFEGNFGVDPIDDLDQWIPPLFYLAKGFE